MYNAEYPSHYLTEDYTTYNFTIFGAATYVWAQPNGSDYLYGNTPANITTTEVTGFQKNFNYYNNNSVAGDDWGFTCLVPGKYMIEVDGFMEVISTTGSTWVTSLFDIYDVTNSAEVIKNVGRLYPNNIMTLYMKGMRTFSYGDVVKIGKTDTGDSTFLIKTANVRFFRVA